LFQLSFQGVHHLVNISETSPAFRVFHLALTAGRSFRGPNFFKDRRMTMSQVVLLYVSGGIAKTVADHAVRSAVWIIVESSYWLHQITFPSFTPRRGKGDPGKRFASP